MYICVLFLLLSLINGLDAACTTQTAIAPLGVNLGSWASTFGTTVTSNIVISQPLLVDVSSVTAVGITIASGGKLYFDWNRSINFTANWILVSSGGELRIGTESCPITNKVTITLNGSPSYVDPMFGSNFLGVASGGTLELHGAKGLGMTWTHLTQTAPAGATQITVQDNISGWQIGDQIVIATTDFSPLQSEQVTITGISGQTISFTPALQYMHYGQITYGVDERAEVGLLTRNILIQGAPQATYFGGHVMMMNGFTAAHAEGVEFYNMGQDQIARYPYHFHLCGNVPSGTYARYNSVHQSNFRCFTIHGTNGVLLEGNVAYKTIGHCYFLEDGVEQNNILRNNLAVLTMPKDFGQHIGSDLSNTGLSSFWITHPNNIIQHNTAVGSYTAGFWFITRLGARGVCACLPQYQNMVNRPCNQFLGLFDGNTAHSCDFGLGIESTNWDSGDNPAQSCDTPVSNWQPTNPDGSLPNTYFTNFTAHHCRQQGLWARMPNIIADGRYADNYNAIEYATGGDQPPYPSLQIVEDSVIVGFSANPGNPVNDQFQSWNGSRSLPNTLGATPINGVVWYDGAQAVVRTTFINFPDSGARMDAPFGGRMADQSQVCTGNYVEDIQFQNVAHRYWILDNVMDGGLTHNFRDLDGSVTGYSGSTALRDIQFYKTPNCVSSNSFMQVCPHKYAQLWVLDMANSGTNNNLIITRSDHTGTSHSDYALQLIGFSSANVWRYQPIISIGSHYLLRWQNHVPNSIVLQLNNAEQGESVGVAICYPPGTIIQSVTRGYASYDATILPQPSNPLTQISSIPSAATMVTSTVQGGGSYFYDAAHSIFYLTVSQRNTRTDYGNFCPEQGCDYVQITVGYTVSAAAVDCTQTAYNNGFQVTTGSWLAQTLTPANSTSTPVTVPPVSTVTPAPSAATPTPSPVTSSISSSTSSRSSSSHASSGSTSSKSTTASSLSSHATSSSSSIAASSSSGSHASSLTHSTSTLSSSAHVSSASSTAKSVTTSSVARGSSSLSGQTLTSSSSHISSSTSKGSSTVSSGTHSTSLPTVSSSTTGASVTSSISTSLSSTTTLLPSSSSTSSSSTSSSTSSAAPDESSSSTLSSSSSTSGLSSTSLASSLSTSTSTTTELSAASSLSSVSSVSSSASSTESTISSSGTTTSSTSDSFSSSLISSLASSTSTTTTELSSASSLSSFSSTSSSSSETSTSVNPASSSTSNSLSSSTTGEAGSTSSLSSVSSSSSSTSSTEDSISSSSGTSTSATLSSSASSLGSTSSYPSASATSSSSPQGSSSSVKSSVTSSSGLHHDGASQGSTTSKPLNLPSSSVEYAELSIASLSHSTLSLVAYISLFIFANFLM